MTRTHFSTDRALGIEDGAYVNSSDADAIGRYIARRLGGSANEMHPAGRNGDTQHYRLTVTRGRYGEIVASGTVYVQR